MEVKIKALEAFYNEKLLKCTQCEFASVSEKGLKSHVVNISEKLWSLWKGNKKQNRNEKPYENTFIQSDSIQM